MCDVGDVECWGCGMLGMWDVRDVGCAGCGMCKMWDVGCAGCEMFGMWNVRDVGRSGCGMFGMWDVGCGMFAGIWDVDLQNAQSQAPSPILLKVCRNFKEGQHFDLLQ